MTTHSLYRFFNADGDLLYVGRTTDARSRWRTHERTKEWFDEVATIARSILPDAEALEQAERVAIEDESPRYNVMLNRPAPAAPVAPGFVDIGQRLFRHADAASYAGVSLAELDRLIAAGAVPVVRIGSAARFDRFDLDAAS